MIIGIDPGLSGAVCVMDGDSVILLEDIPTTVFSSGHTKSHIDAALLADILREYSGARLAVVERVHSRRGEGACSAFSFGDSYGCVRTVLAVLGIPAIFPLPREWKKDMKLNADKEFSRARALEMFPCMASKLKFKKNHDRAEALLLAVWGSRQE